MSSQEAEAGRVAVPAIGYAVRVINYLSRTPEGAGVSEMARALGINKSTCHNVLTTLTTFRLLTKHPRHATYRLGPRLIEWGTASRRQFSVRTTIRDRVRHVVDEIGLTCLLGQVLADELGIVVVDRLVPADKDVLVVPVGEVYPMSAPAMGRVVLSLLDDDEAISVAHRLDMNESTTEAEFLDQLDIVRASRMATSCGDYEKGVNAVATAVTRGRGEVVFVLCVIGREEDLPCEVLASVGSRLITLADELEMEALSVGI